MKMTQRPLMPHEKLLPPPTSLLRIFCFYEFNCHLFEYRCTYYSGTGDVATISFVQGQGETRRGRSQSPSLCNLRISFDRSNANKLTGSIQTRSFIFPRKIIRLNGNGRENWRCPGSQTEANAERNLFVWRNF